MMSDKLSAGFQKIIDRAGAPIRLRYYNQLIDPVYDDDVTLTQSGADVWTSGVILNINSKDGSTDSILLEQGKIINSDKKLYTNGSLVFTDTNLQVKIQIGSPTGDQYSFMADGGQAQQVQGIDIYKRAYIRRLTNGSLVGE